MRDQLAAIDTAIAASDAAPPANEADRAMIAVLIGSEATRLATAGIELYGASRKADIDLAAVIDTGNLKSAEIALNTIVTHAASVAGEKYATLFKALQDAGESDINAWLITAKNAENANLTRGMAETISTDIKVLTNAMIAIAENAGLAFPPFRVDFHGKTGSMPSVTLDKNAPFNFAEGKYPDIVVRYDRRVFTDWHSITTRENVFGLILHALVHLDEIQRAIAKGTPENPARIPALREHGAKYRLQAARLTLTCKGTGKDLETAWEARGWLLPIFEWINKTCLDRFNPPVIDKSKPQNADKTAARMAFTFACPTCGYEITARNGDRPWVSEASVLPCPCGAKMEATASTKKLAILARTVAEENAAKAIAAIKEKAAQARLETLASPPAPFSPKKTEPDPIPAPTPGAAIKRPGKNKAPAAPPDAAPPDAAVIDHLKTASDAISEPTAIAS
jgi:hypothetical protein